MDLFVRIYTIIFKGYLENNFLGSGRWLKHAGLCSYFFCTWVVVPTSDTTRRKNSLSSFHLRQTLFLYLIHCGTIRHTIILDRAGILNGMFLRLCCDVYKCIFGNLLGHRTGWANTGKEKRHTNYRSCTGLLQLSNGYNFTNLSDSRIEKHFSS